MDKRGLRYLRYALFISAQYVSMWCPIFKDYYQKKRAEDKHYFVALSHVAKKLLRIFCLLQETGESFQNFSRLLIVSLLAERRTMESKKIFLQNFRRVKRRMYSSC